MGSCLHEREGCQGDHRKLLWCQGEVSNFMSLEAALFRCPCALLTRPTIKACWEDFLLGTTSTSVPDGMCENKPGFPAVPGNHTLVQRQALCGSHLGRHLHLALQCPCVSAVPFLSPWSFRSVTVSIWIHNISTFPLEFPRALEAPLPSLHF